jgi:hypothetical protein
MNDFLYGVEYIPEPVVCESCESPKLYDLTATNHYLCLNCGNQFPVEEAKA